jgi:hypothetical protein
MLALMYSILKFADSYLNFKIAPLKVTIVQPRGLSMYRTVELVSLNLRIMLKTRHQNGQRGLVFRCSQLLRLPMHTLGQVSR